MYNYCCRVHSHGKTSLLDAQVDAKSKPHSNWLIDHLLASDWLVKMFQFLIGFGQVFSQGMQQEVGLTSDLISRLFPRLHDLVDLHMAFLTKIVERQSQRDDRFIDDFGDLLVHQVALSEFH